jgi:hypothetical protein
LARGAIPQKTAGDMFRLIKDLIFAWQYKRAVKKAVKLSKLHGMKFYVVYLNGGLKVVPKKAIKELVARRRFRKGVTVQDIEKRALFVTH